MLSGSSIRESDNEGFSIPKDTANHGSADLPFILRLGTFVSMVAVENSYIYPSCPS